jgi:hypothetical protein
MALQTHAVRPCRDLIKIIMRYVRFTPVASLDHLVSAGTRRRCSFTNLWMADIEMKLQRRQYRINMASCM